MLSPDFVRNANTGFFPWGRNAETFAASSSQPSSPSVRLPSRTSEIGNQAPVSASTTRVSPVTHLPRQIVSTLRGIRKYSTVRASANEFGGMMHQSPLKSTNDFSSKFLGSTIVELRLVKSLNSFEQRIS